MTEDEHPGPAHGAAATSHAHPGNGSSMTRERWEQAKRLFEMARGLDSAGRAALFERECPNDSELRREVESLLSGDRRAGDFLERPILAVAAKTESVSVRIGTLTLGQVLSRRFRVVRLLGQGGMGEVYEAEDLELGERVALKTVRPDIAAEPMAMARFKQEIQLARRVTHPNVCRMFDLQYHRPLPDEAGSSPTTVTFLTMELLEGETLATHIGRVGRVGPIEALPLVQQMADALAAAHEVGVVHRDFKPGNVILVPTKSGEGWTRAVITDFGLATAVAAAEHEPSQSLARLARTVSVVGTVAYMAPEQLAGHEATPASDIYALGLVMYEMVTGKHPFPEVLRRGGILHRLTELPPFPRTLVRDLPARWESAILRCLAIDPAERFQSARQVAAAIGGQTTRDSAGTLVIWSDGTKMLTVTPEPEDLGWWVRLRTFAHTRWVLLSIVALISVLTLILWRRERPPALPELIPATADGGLTWDPSLSADGKVMAYSSDRAGPGSNLDIWIKNVAGGSALQVTHGPADNVDPALSPDGSMVAYRSEREDGGIYLRPVYGGYERLVARFGRNPKFSPDGTQILYWTGEERNITEPMGPGGRMYVVSLQGGPPRPLQPDFVDARYPVWGTDGDHIMFQGSKTVAPSYAEGSDWWVTRLEGSESVKTGAFAILHREALTLFGCPFYWRKGAVVFAARKTFGNDLWQLPVSTNDWQASGPIRRLTSGTADDISPWVSADGRLAFTTFNAAITIWSIFQSASGEGSNLHLTRLSEASAVDTLPSLSSDGGKLVFFRRVGEERSIWLKDMRTGQEVSLALPGRAVPVISRDGSKVAYSVVEKGKTGIYVAAIAGGPSERVCEDCGEIADWSTDQHKILFESGKPAGVGLLDASAKRQGTLLMRAHSVVDQAQLSPDGKWVAFVSKLDGDHSRVEVAPVEDQMPIPEAAWIPLTGDGRREIKPAWSADGNSVFMFSNRDGFTCLWRVRLDPVTKHPFGSPVIVKHFHSPGLSLMHLSEPEFGLSVGGGIIAIDLAEATGNIFTAELGNR